MFTKNDRNSFHRRSSIVHCRILSIVFLGYQHHRHR